MENDNINLVLRLVGTELGSRPMQCAAVLIDCTDLFR